MTGQLSTGSPGVFSAFFSIGRSGGGDGREVGPQRPTRVVLGLVTAVAALGALLVLFLARPARADNGFSMAKTIWPVSGSCNSLGSSPVGPSFDHYEGFVGVPISFCVVVSNGTGDSVQNIVVIDDNSTPTDTTDDIPLTLTDATGTPITALADGFKGYAIYTYTPTSIGDFINRVNASGDMTGATPTAVSSTDTAQYDIYNVGVEKTSDAGASLTEGDTVTFTFTLTNDAGSVDTTYLLTGLTDTVFGDLTDAAANPTSTCATLVGQAVPPLGGSVTCQLTVTMDVPGLYVPDDFAPSAGGTHSNAVEAIGTDQYGNELTRTDGETFIVEDAPGSISVTKVATPSQVAAPGEMVDFVVTVTNTSAVDVVELTTFEDSEFGNVDAECLIDPSTTPPTDVAAVILGPGETHTCATFTRMVEGDAGEVHMNTISVSGSDDDGQPLAGEGKEEVEIIGESSIDLTKTAIPVSVSAPGDDVTFTFEVTNTGQTTVTLGSLMDTSFDLTDTTVHPTSTCTTAGVGPLAPGETYTCELTEFLSGAAGDQHYNLATFCVTDGSLEANGDPVEVCAADDAIVDFVEPTEAGSIKIRKRADLSEVPESGADVTFLFIIANTGGVDVTLTELTDTVYGDLSVECGIEDAAGTLTPVVLVPAPGPGDAHECEIVRNVSGDAGSEHKNRVTVTGEDANGNEVDDRATRKIQIVDEPSAMSVVKTANPTSVPSAGGSVDFTFAVTNDSASDSIEVTSLIDSVYGDLTVDCGWDIAPPPLAPGDTATCVITRTVVPTGGSTGGSGTPSSATPSSTNSSQSYLSPPAPAACSGSAWVAGANSAMGSHAGHSLVLNTGLSVSAGTWSVDDFTAWDADIDRPNYPQAAEIVRIEFHLNGAFVAASTPTNDLPDGTVTAWVSGGLGVVTLPNGADEVKLVHSNSYDGTSGTNSFQPISLCLVQESTTPIAGVPHTNTGTACATDDDGNALCAGAEATVTFDAVDEPPACVGGRPRWWRSNHSDWVAPYTPNTSTQTLFTPVSIDWSMNQALGLGGNSSLAGRERQLVREATAAILNESANPSAYPVSSVAIIQQAVDNALDSGSRSEMLRVARILFRWNRDVCA